MTVFPALFYTSTREIRTPLYTSSLKRVPPFGRSLPVLYSIIGSSPSPHPGHGKLLSWYTAVSATWFQTSCDILIQLTPDNSEPSTTPTGSSRCLKVNSFSIQVIFTLDNSNVRQLEPFSISLKV